LGEQVRKCGLSAGKVASSFVQFGVCEKTGLENQLTTQLFSSHFFKKKPPLLFTLFNPIGPQPV
jgi:hypothetical protein